MWREIEGIGILLFSLFSCVSASGREQDSLRTLTPYQIQSILDYVETYGDILSVSELSHVDGFTKDDAVWLWESARQYLNRDLSRPQHQISSKFRKKYKQEGFSISGKYFFDNGGNLSAGAVIDNDPGEKFPDFISAHVKYKGLVAGDYSARFGQGLVLWKSFSYQSMGEPSVLMKRGKGIQGYKSTDEENFLRGAACSFNLGRHTGVSVFGSFKGVDVKPRDSGQVHEFVAGANAQYERGRFKVGLTAVCYSYDRPVKKVVRIDNQLQIYEGLWGNAGLDFLASFGSLRLFGECGLDAHASPAALLGALWSPDYSFEAGIQARAYSPSYIANHSVESVNNDIGASASVKYIKGGWKFNLNAEYDYHPWYGYNKPAGEIEYKLRFVSQYTCQSCANLLAQVTFGSSLKTRIHCSLPVGQFTFSARLESNYVSAQDKGHACYLEVAYLSGKLQLAARGTYYDTDSWNSRIYLYEKDTPQSFSSQVYYKKGLGGYLVARYSPTKSLDLYLKVQQNYCSFFIRIFIPG